jgi:hypothetical protein
LLRKKYLSSTKYFLLYAHSLSVRIRKVTHIVTVYDHIRLYTIIYDRIRQSYSSVYGVESFTFESLRIFIRSPYTESGFTVSLRIRCRCTETVYDLRISPFFSVNGRLRPCIFDLGWKHKLSAWLLDCLFIRSSLTGRRLIWKQKRLLSINFDRRVIGVEEHESDVSFLYSFQESFFYTKDQFLIILVIPII